MNDPIKKFLVLTPNASKFEVEAIRHPPPKQVFHKDLFLKKGFFDSVLDFHRAKWDSAKFDKLSAAVEMDINFYFNKMEQSLTMLKSQVKKAIIE